MTTMDANSNKIRGLLAFIKHPNTSEHEKDTAQNLLDNLCRKYGIDPNSLEEIELIEYTFKAPKLEWEQQLALRLFWQISGKPANELSYRTRCINNKPKEYLLPFTNSADYVQFCEAYAFYRKLYQKELKKIQDSLYVAFVVKHDIKGITADEKNENEEPKERMAPEEFEMLRSMLNSLSKDKFNFKKRIG